jgi:hypothetical protein
MGFVLLFACAGHLALFTLPALAGLAVLCVVRRRSSERCAPFWPVAIPTAVLALAVRGLLLSREPLQTGTAAVWPLTFGALFQTALFATWAVALLVLLWSRAAPGHRGLARALLGGVLLSLALQLPATFLLGPAYQRIGIVLTY